GFRVREGHPGREHQCGEALPVGAAQIGHGHAGGSRGGNGGGTVVKGRDLGAPGDQRPSGRTTAGAPANNGDVLTAEGGDGDHAAITSASASKGRSARAGRR